MGDGRVTRWRIALAALTVVVTAGGCGSSGSEGSSSSRAADEAAIRQTMDAWPAAIAKGDKKAACDLFARDLVLVYPGQADRGWKEQCATLGKAIDKGIVGYDKPKIEAVRVDGDLGTVQVTWTARVSLPGGGTDTEVERGLDVFERGDDGTWRIAVSHAFPVEPTSKGG